ncbi:MAG: hypothetical protein HOP15_10465 [Planctomycetes bacterium]|nr:hypothetical protein [Planctomycetota bacterium]
MRPRPVARSLVLGVLAFAALFAGLRWNVWHSARPVFFDTAMKDTEALVIGRLAVARALGFFAWGGLLGFTGDGPEVVTFDTDVLWRAYDAAAQTRTYLEQSDFRSYGPYFTHSGLQGSAFVVLDRGLGFLAPSTRLALFFSLTAALVGALYAGLVVLVQRELGTCAALLSFAAVLASPWLTVFGRNLYLSLWLFWVPALAIGLVLWPRGRRRREGRWLAGATCLGFLARFLCGYEFVTETVAIAAVPILYCSLRDAVGLRVFLTRTLVVTGASVLALALSLAVLALQIAHTTGSFANLQKHMQFAVARRAHGDPSRMPPAYANSLRANTGEVVRFYFEDAFDRGAKHKTGALRWLLARSQTELIACVLAAGAWFSLRARWLPPEDRGRILGLAAGIAVTFAGVLAWLVLFKAHSFIHTGVNPLLWHLGFYLLGAALVGWALEDALRLSWRRARALAGGRTA